MSRKNVGVHAGGRWLVGKGSSFSTTNGTVNRASVLPLSYVDGDQSDFNRNRYMSLPGNTGL